MHEMALRGGQVFVVAEQADFVAHAARAEMRHPQTGADQVGKGDGGKIIAMRLDHETDHGACCDVERALSDQIRIHRGVEIGIIDRVVDVAIGIVVHPARGDVLEMAIGVSSFRFWTRVGHAGQRLRALVLALPGTAPFSAARPSFTITLRSRSRTFLTPHKAMLTSSSRRRMSIALATPSCPPAPS